MFSARLSARPNCICRSAQGIRFETIFSSCWVLLFLLGTLSPRNPFSENRCMTDFNWRARSLLWKSYSYIWCTSSFLPWGLDRGSSISTPTKYIAWRRLTILLTQVQQLAAISVPVLHTQSSLAYFLPRTRPRSDYLGCGHDINPLNRVPCRVLNPGALKMHPLDLALGGSWWGKIIVPLYMSTEKGLSVGAIYMPSPQSGVSMTGPLIPIMPGNLVLHLMCICRYLVHLY